MTEKRRQPKRAKSKASDNQKTAGMSCDWKAPLKNRPSSSGKNESEKNSNRILRYKDNFKWSGTRTEKYKQYTAEGWSAIARKVLIGSHGESSKYHLRYFEIAPGGYSSLEKHRHEHVVICLRGKGKVLIGKKSHEIGYLDTVYIAPNTVHQLTNPYDVPFGFFCIVNAKRDKPKPVSF